MVVWPAAEFTTVVAQDGSDLGVMLLKEGQDILIEHMHGRKRQLVGVEPAPRIAGIAIDDRLHVDLADTLESADKEGVHSHKVAGMLRFNMPFPEFRAESFQQANLFVGKFKRLFPDALFKPNETFLLGQQVVTPRTPPELTWIPLRDNS